MIPSAQENEKRKAVVSKFATTAFDGRKWEDKGAKNGARTMRKDKMKMKGQENEEQI